MVLQGGWSKLDDKCHQTLRMQDCLCSRRLNWHL